MEPAAPELWGKVISAAVVPVLWPQAFYFAAPLFILAESFVLAAAIAALFELRVSLGPAEAGREFVEQ